MKVDARFARVRETRIPYLNACACSPLGMVDAANRVWQFVDLLSVLLFVTSIIDTIHIMSDQQASEYVPFRPFQRAKQQISASVGKRHVDFGRNAVEPCSSLLLVTELHPMAVGLRRSLMAPIHFSPFWRGFLPGSFDK